MHKNYYLFKRQIREIEDEISGAQILSAFTVHKNELIFELQKLDNTLHLVMCVNPARPFVLLKSPANYKVSKYNKFEMIYGQFIQGIELVSNNKFIKIELQNYQLQAYYFSAAPNIVVYGESKELIDTFKSLKNSALVREPINNKPQMTEELIKEILDSSSNMNLKGLLKNIFPAANKQILDELYVRLNTNENESVKIFNRESLLEVLVHFYKEIETGPAYIYRKGTSTTSLLLYKSTRFESEQYDIEKFSSINKAWHIFLKESQRQNEYDKLFSPILKAINKRKHILQTTLSKLKEAEDIEGRKQIADLMGNLILSNKHKIPRGSDSVELTNIFSDQQEVIRIKLNPKKTSVENATYYFQKYKNIAEKKQVIALKKNTYQKELQEIVMIEEKVHNASVKDLEKIREQLEDMNVLQSSVVKGKDKQTLKYSFKRLILDNEWDIYIGKNNQNNELLTFGFANKWDLWLHAQGVSGSHVIIKMPAKNSSTPKHVIEQAARIAAANSKAKHSTTVPVVYTEVRHVSKIRGAQPGTVSIKNEKVIFVEPINLNQ